VLGALHALPFVVSLYILAMGALLAVNSLFNVNFITTYFAFMHFPIGSGSLLIVCGAMTYGSYGTLGQIIGGTSLAWGLLSIICHIMWRANGMAFNTAILAR
jgi:hypothetical protein